MRGSRLLGGGDRGNLDVVPYQGPQLPTAAKTPVTTSNQAHPLPILWGTGKVSAYLIEGGPPRKSSISYWVASTSYPGGSIVASDGGAWLALKGGTSGGSGNNPQGQGANPSFWNPSTAYAAGNVRQNAQSAGVTGAAAFVYQCTVAGASAGSGGPGGTGSNIIDGGAHWQYLGETSNALPTGGEGSFSINQTPDGLVWKYLQQLPYDSWHIALCCAVCEGEVQGALKLYWDQERYVTPSTTDLGKLLKLYLGPDALGQAPTGNFDSSGYQHTVLIAPNTAAGRNVPTGTKSEVPALALELQGVMFGSAVPDVSPADIVYDVLTHTRRGVGWPSGRVDAVTITGAGASSFRTYCDAAGFRFSMLVDSQRSALDILADILNATNSDAIWSGGALKIIPLGDQNIAAPVYGAVAYVAPNAAQYNLTATDLLDPVQVRRREDVDCFNDYPVQYFDRFEAYQQNTVEDPDQTDVEKRGGMWRGPTLALPCIFPDGSYPIALSRILAQRSLAIRNTYTFRLPWRYLLLEPTDVVTLTDTVLGLNLTPVRIVSMTEGSDFTWTVVAEDYPSGVAASKAYAPQPGDGYQPNAAGTSSAGIPSAFGTGALTGGGLDNIWPNPTSEVSPSSNVSVADDGSSPEWDYRLNAGAGAKAGDWVRSLASGVGLFYAFPVVPDDIIQLSCWSKNISGANGNIALVFYNSSGGVVTTVPAPTAWLSGPYTWGTAAGAGAWGWNMANWRVPAGAVRCRAYLNHNGTVASVGANYYDSILLKKLPPAGPAGGSYAESDGLVTLDCTLADHFFSQAVAAGATTIAAPSNGYIGQRIAVKFKNARGGGLGCNWTFNAAYKIAGGNVFVGIPANAFSRTIDFVYDGTNWVEVSRTPADVPN